MVIIRIKPAVRVQACFRGSRALSSDRVLDTFTWVWIRNLSSCKHLSARRLFTSSVCLMFAAFPSCFWTDVSYTRWSLISYDSGAQTRRKKTGNLVFWAVRCRPHVPSGEDTWLPLRMRAAVNGFGVAAGRRKDACGPESQEIVFLCVADEARRAPGSVLWPSALTDRQKVCKATTSHLLLIITLMNWFIRTKPKLEQSKPDRSDSWEGSALNHLSELIIDSSQL